MNIVRIEHPENLPKGLSICGIVEFLYSNLGQFSDTPQAIRKSIDHAFSNEVGKGGFLVLALKDNDLVGVAVLNKTGMDEFVPPWLLVYIAVNKEQRRQGIGTTIIEKVKEFCGSDIALHVEYHNPAKRLYESLGFKSKYAEMRWHSEQ